MTTESNGRPHSEPTSGSAKGAASRGDCHRLRELIPAYAIGATDPDETAFVEAGLPDCPEAAAELTDYLMLSDELLYIVPMASENRPVADVPMPYLEPVAAARTNPGTSTRPAPVVVSRQSVRWIVAASLALIIVGIVNGYTMVQLQRLEQGQRDLASQFEAARTALLPVNAGPALHRDLLPNGTTDVSPEAHAVLIWNAAENVGSLYVTGLSPLSLEETYQLWLVRDDHSMSLGTFEVDNAGTGTLVFASPEPVVSFQHVGVSIEPVAGSTTPTTPHLVIGEI
jgi:hypothetical protein